MNEIPPRKSLAEQEFGKWRERERVREREREREKEREDLSDLRLQMGNLDFTVTKPWCANEGWNAKTSE